MGNLGHIVIGTAGTFPCWQQQTAQAPALVLAFFLFFLFFQANAASHVLGKCLKLHISLVRKERAGTSIEKLNTSGH